MSISFTISARTVSARTQLIDQARVRRAVGAIVRSDDLFSVFGLHVLVPSAMGIQGLATYLREHRQILSRRFELSVVSRPKDVTRLVVDGWS